jgi:hypothetical protein
MINSLVTNALPVGSELYLWDATNQSYRPPSVYQNIGGTTNWSINYDVSPGKGFVIWIPSTASYPQTLEFIGQVLQGTNSVFVPGSNKFSLIADIEPVGGGLTDVHQFPGADGDEVYLFDVGPQLFEDAFTFFGGFGCYDPKHVAGTNGPGVNVGQPFFVQNPGADRTWVRTFSVQAPQRQPPATITRLAILGGFVTLYIGQQTGPYNVQFSTDRVSWETVATNQTGDVWTDPKPVLDRGYYQLVNP